MDAGLQLEVQVFEKQVHVQTAVCVEFGSDCGKYAFPVHSMIVLLIRKSEPKGIPPENTFQKYGRANGSSFTGLPNCGTILTIILISCPICIQLDISFV